MAETFETIHVQRELRMHSATPKLTNVHGLQASSISDVDALTGGESPTEAEFNALAEKFNALLAAARGVGLISPS